MLSSICLAAVVAASAAPAAAAPSSLPHLRRQGSAVQLIVDGKPFLVRGGELGNSTASNPAYLAPYWKKLGALNVNTVLAPVYWDLIEPEEGRFDFTTLDGLVRDARANGMRLVLLWFASWKNTARRRAGGFGSGMRSGPTEILNQVWLSPPSVGSPCSV